jgi:site-specific recombinase XerD
MHHMMEKASSIWSKETGLDRNPADQVEVKRPDDARDRYLSAKELQQAEAGARRKEVPQRHEGLNRTIHRMRLIVLLAVTTGMRASEIFGLLLDGRLYDEGLIGVRAKLKGGKMRYVPMTPSELAGSCGRTRRDFR